MFLILIIFFFFFFSCQAKNLASLFLPLSIYVGFGSLFAYAKQPSKNKTNSSTEFQSSASQSDQTFFFHSQPIFILYLHLCVSELKKTKKKTPIFSAYFKFAFNYPAFLFCYNVFKRFVFLFRSNLFFITFLNVLFSKQLKKIKIIFFLLFPSNLFSFVFLNLL